MRSFIGPKRLLGMAATVGLLVVTAAQATGLDAKDYARAEKFMSYNTEPLVDHAVTRVHWLDGTHFWYRDHDQAGDHYRLMDVTDRKVTPLLDQSALAKALTDAGAKQVSANALSISSYRVEADGRLAIKVDDAQYSCRLATGAPRCEIRHKARER